MARKTNQSRSTHVAADPADNAAGNVTSAKTKKAGRPKRADLSGDVDLGKKQFVGRRLMRLLDEQLQNLRAADAAHGNRVLQYDHVVVAHLLAFFNPTINTLRPIEDVFEHPCVRRLFGLPRVPHSTLADAQRLFNPALLKPIVAHLARQVAATPHDARLDEITRKIVAVDASFFEVAGRIAWALPHNTTSGRGSVQLCLHLDVIHGTPDGFTVLGGQESETRELSNHMQKDRLYVLDRAYQSYERLDAIVAAGSDFVVRLRKTANLTVVEDRPLTAEDRLAWIQSDQVVRPTRCDDFSTPVRLIEIRVPDKEEPVRLLTNRLDAAAAVIGLLYRHRWQIELFFRWLKCIVQLRHFTSESANGMSIQLYVALIGTLLIALEVGGRPSKYDFAQMSLAVNGMVTLAEARQVAAKRRAERARAAAWQKQYNARKKTAK